MVVVDTSVLFAAADDRDGDHAACVDVVETRSADELLVPATAVVETAWLIADRLGDAAEHRFIASIVAGDVTVIELTGADYHRCAELLATYEDLHLGLVDASLVAIAERFDVVRVATLNHRDFRVVRPRHIEAFELIP
ncbi:MAG: PIN domain-containing protein [Actinomycetota bacterium]|nr:PIN domain-containing protein [Actinomycetota bacterium]